MLRHLSFTHVPFVLLFLHFAMFTQEVQSDGPPPKVANDQTNDILFQGNHVVFKDHTPKDDAGNVIEGIFYIPVVDKKDLGPHRASPGAVITVMTPPEGTFKCSKKLRKRLDEAKALKVVTVTEKQ